MKKDMLYQQKEKMEAILADMRASISYTKNKEQDILAFMEQYQKSPSAYRPTILRQLRACMDGEDYPNPFARNYRYTMEDVTACEVILQQYLAMSAVAKGDSIQVKACVEQAVLWLGELNQRCDGALIDPWRRDRLFAFFDITTVETGSVWCENMALQHSMC